MKNCFKVMIISGLACMFSLHAVSQDIWKAINDGDAVKTREWISKDPALLNQRNADLLTPLNLAASLGQKEIAELLLDLGADPAIGDNENSQPIHLAAIYGHVPVVELLLARGNPINTLDDNGMTPLLFAASRGQLDASRFLVEKGADTKIVSSRGINALQMAVIGGNAELVKYFISKGFSVNSAVRDGLTVLHTAASFGRTEIVKYLVEKGARIDAESEEGAQPLALAVGRNSYDAAQFLISKGVEVGHRDKQGFAAIHEAAGRGNLGVVQLLLDHGADINSLSDAGWTPLTNAAWAPNAAEIGRFLIQHGASVNPDPCREVKSCTCGPNFNTPLHQACAMNKADLVKILIDNGAKVNLLNREGWPPMFSAVRSGNAEVVAYLINHGAFLNVKDPRTGGTELHMAAALGFGEVAGMLIDRGADFKAKNNDGLTPVDFALNYGQNMIAYRMLAAGAADSSLASYFGKECLLAKKYNAGEAEVWFLGHSGWAIKTSSHFLVFDYFDNPRSKKPDNPCLSSGFITDEALAVQNTVVFSSHAHQDHYNRSIFNWDDNNDNVKYVLCHKPADADNPYTYIPVDESAEVAGMKIQVIRSTDSGGGFLVEVDGLVIFYMGDHSNGNDELMPEFTAEIDKVAQLNKDIDLMFGPIRGCSLGTPEQVKAGTYYALEKLHPALFIPMHSGDYTFEYRNFTEQAHNDGVDTPMKPVFAKGDRFHYLKGEPVAEVYQ